MNTRRKGQVVVLKAIRFALSYPGTKTLTLYQVSRWATEQPFDLLVLRHLHHPRFVEVRSGQWRTGKASTVALSQLPGMGYQKQIWKLDDRETVPRIREWDGQAWVRIPDPWAEARRRTHAK